MPAADGEQAALYLPVTVPLEKVRACLSDEATLVEYFRIGQRLVAFLVTRETLDVVPVAMVSRVRHVLRLLQFQLSWASPGGRPQSAELQRSHRDSCQAHLRELYDELIAPVRRRLRTRHLVVVPHDVLHYVPFHALHDGERHLIDSFTVSYAPSASVYALCHGKDVRRDGGALVLGVPDPRAPFILEEARSVAAALPGSELYVGPEADAATLRARGPGSRFVHVASHGFFRADNPMFSGIRLGGSYLTLYDLYQLHLPAELVTLSACVTGLNVVAAGDEVLGLARGIFTAGAASLLVALWEVPDESTALFMKVFYGELLRSGGGDKAAALRGAIGTVREAYPHPVHWAPFALLGRVLAS
jgi:CHAT domain-containing protein